MSVTPAGASLSKTLTELGAVPYDVLIGNWSTTKLERFRLPNGRPIAIQINNKTPRMWLLPEHDTESLFKLGKKTYKPNEDRHHHLRQIREFRNRELLKVEITAADPSVIKEVLRELSRGGPLTPAAA